jgi:hypothetical protein
VFTDNADPNLQTLTTDDEGFANLGLEIWNADFTQLYAESISLYNNVQELDYIIPQDGTYAIRVDYFGQMFGTPVAEGYGLAWAAPEPATLLLLLPGLSLILRRPQRGSERRSRPKAPNRASSFSDRPG